MELLQACKNGRVDLVRQLLHCGDIEVNAQNNNGWTTLRLICQYGYTECVEELLSTGSHLLHEDI